MQRLQPRAAAAPRRSHRGQGPAEDRAGDAAAGRARAWTGARSCCAAPARHCRCMAPRCSARASSKRASPKPRRRPPKQPVLVSIFMEGGWDALSVLAPVEGSPLPRTASAAGPGRRGRQGVQPRTRSLMWHPAAGGLAELHEEGKVSVIPGDRAMTRRTRATSPAATTGRSASSTPRHAPAGWGASSTSTGEPGNPLQGLSLDYSLAPALATTKMPVAAVSSPADYDMWAYGLGEPITDPALETFGELGAPRTPLARLRAGPRRVAGHEHRAQPDGGVRRVPRQIDVQIDRPLPHDRR